jgi:hypothetical protein
MGALDTATGQDPGVSRNPHYSKDLLGRDGRIKSAHDGQWTAGHTHPSARAVLRISYPPAPNRYFATPKSISWRSTSPVFNR